jgi:hypothetical protein
MVDNIPNPEMWNWLIDTSDAWAEHSSDCEICVEHVDEDDVWRIIQTECTMGRLLIAAIKQVEIELGIAPTNR